MLHLSNNLKEKKRNINIDLAVLPSYNNPEYYIKVLQSPETQEVKYKKRTITTFGFSSTPFCPKSSQNPTNDMVLSCLYNDMSPHQVLPIKDDASSLPLPSRIFFHLPPLLGNHSEAITLKLIDSPRS